MNTAKVLSIIAMLTAAAVTHGQAQQVAAGPRTTPVPQHAVVRHVSVLTGSDSADGSAQRPWKTVSHALRTINDAAPGRTYAVLVAAGDYYEPTLKLESHVDLYGGFDPRSWLRDIATYQTVLDGEYQRRIAIGANDVTIDGFIFRRGSVAGHGGGLLLEGVSATVTNNVFAENTTQPPRNFAPKVWHETAHDGGAIACINGCSAVIANNIFDRNTTIIGRGAGVACDNEQTRSKRAAPRVVRNVFTRNVASIGPDTARSGDGGAISFYGWCNGEISQNVIAENAAPSKNDGGGIFLNLWAAPVVTENIFVGNVSGDDAGAFFVGGQKHHYGTPLDPVPPASEFFVRFERNILMGNRNGAPTSGAFRATMMTRGAFTDNVTAENPGGVYTQRSEITLANNTFVENARNEDEERTAPGPIIWRHNIIAGTRSWGAPVKEEKNCTEGVHFVDDGRTVKTAGASYDAARHVTRVEVGGAHAPGSLRGRVVQAGNRWGVIRDNTASTIDVWGDFGTPVSLTVKPTYTVAAGSACASVGARSGS